MGLACRLSNHLGNLSRIKVVYPAILPRMLAVDISEVPDTKRQRPFPTFCHSTVRRFSLVDNDVVIAETGRWQEVGLPMKGSALRLQYSILLLLYK